MKIETRKFGTIEVHDDQAISFVQPVIGFPNLQSYVMIDTGGHLRWLQSLENPNVVFPLVDPLMIKADYDIEIPTTDAESLELENAQDVSLWCITVLSKDKNELRANLKAPIVMNRKNGKARQVVLNDTDLPIQYHFVPETTESNKEVAEYAGANA